MGVTVWLKTCLEGAWPPGTVNPIIDLMQRTAVAEAMSRPVEIVVNFVDSKFDVLSVVRPFKTSSNWFKDIPEISSLYRWHD